MSKRRKLSLEQAIQLLQHSDSDSDGSDLSAESDAASVGEESIANIDAPNANLSDTNSDGNEDQLEMISEDSSTDNYFDSETDNVDTASSTSKITPKSGKVWMTSPPAQSRTPARNIVTLKPGLTDYSKNVQNDVECLKLFITPEIVLIIVTETNRKAQFVYSEWNRDHPDRKLTWTDTTELEIYAYVGLLILSGVMRARKESIKELWTSNTKYRRPIFVATMSRNRFEQLQRFIRFDDFNTRAVRRATDRLAPIRDIMNMFVDACKRAVLPGPYLTIDEQLVGFRGRCPFRVYMKDKPDKYGIKLWCMCDAVTNYPVNIQVYLGKENNIPEKNQGARVIRNMVENLQGGGYGIYADNFFTNLSVAEELLQRNITYVGTIRQNKPDVPTMMKPSPTRKELSSEFLFDQNSTLVSYVPKKRRSVVLLSTQHRDVATAGEDVAYKPLIILDYNKYKGGVDNMDKKVKEYRPYRKSNRWPTALFANIIAISSGICAYTVFTFKFPDWQSRKTCRRRLFLRELGEALVTPLIIARSNNLSGLSTDTISAMSAFIPELDSRQQAIAAVARPTVKTKGRCFLCKRADDRKVASICGLCHKFVCPKHSSVKVTKEVKCNTC